WRAAAAASGAVAGRSTPVSQNQAFSIAAESERHYHQGRLFAHIFGDPSHPYPAPESWPPTVRGLAESLYGGEPCHFALHDALLEAGHPQLAGHFREADHPKGCWALDLILDRN